MRLSTLLICSLLGMGSSSAAVTWMTPRTLASASNASDAKADDAQPGVKPAWAGTERVAEVGAPAEPIPAEFSQGETVRLQGRLGHSVLPAQGEHETYVMVEVGARTDAAGNGRAPVNLSIVIDRSGSMKGQRLDNAIAAARGMLARLQPTDTVSVVAYANQAQLLVAPTSLERLDRFGFERALAELRGRGHTCISCGVDMARAQLRRRTGAVNRILLLSDGVANRGLTSTTDFRALGDIARRERTAVASVGVDVDYDDRTLFALSQASNGNHYFVEDPSGLPRVFEQEVRGLVGTLADRVDVRVGLPKGVQLLEVIARGHRREGDDVMLSFGSLGAGQERSAVLRVRVDPAQAQRAVAELTMTYRDLGDQRDHQEAGLLGLSFDPEQTQVARLDPRVEERLGRKDTLDALLDANAAFTRGDVGLARRHLRSARGGIQSRKRRSGASSGSKIDRDFDAQLQALGEAEATFDDAVKSAPRPAAAPKQRKGKKAIRANTVRASPFG